jgi:hypothetical protein
MITESNPAERGLEASLIARRSPSPILAGRKEHPFAQPIWDIRLQAAWITFTGIYLIAGSKIMEYMAHPRWVSSLFLTIAAVLVLLLVCHTVVAKDKSASRKTLLVALTACLFFVQKSGETYHDNNGVIFATIFSVIILSLVWLRDESALREQIKFDTISVLVATIIFSIVGLMSTFLERLLIEAQHVSENRMLIAPHVSIIMVGAAVFYLLDNYIAERTNSIELFRYSFLDCFIRSLIAVVIAVAVVHITNIERLTDSILNTRIGVVFTAGYVFVFMISALVCIWLVYTSIIDSIVSKAPCVAVLAVMSACAVTALHIILQMLCEQSPDNFISLCIGIYILPAGALMVATIVSNIVFRGVCRELYEVAGALVE